MYRHHKHSQYYTHDWNPLMHLIVDNVSYNDERTHSLHSIGMNDTYLLSLKSGM